MNVRLVSQCKRVKEMPSGPYRLRKCPVDLMAWEGLCILHMLLSLVSGPVDCTGEQWLEARKASATSMHVLRPMAISVDLFQCMIASSDLPKYVNTSDIL